MFELLKEKYKTWKDNRFLKKHGCTTWNQYNHMYDPDYNIRASRVDDYYHGYPYWHVFENRKHPCYTLLYDNGPGGYRYGYHDIIEWMQENTKHKHRTDFLRVFKQTALGPNSEETPEWWINEIGGGDHIFVAFKDAKDYNWFMLRWA